ncbi:MAG: hypothetical protein U5Q03_00050 [Bacteroidota bacterium]|nr:hypothetical protein [Bacteroidota bacterium]
MTREIPWNENDIPDILKRWHKPETGERKRTEKSFCVPAKEIRDNNYPTFP